MAELVKDLVTYMLQERQAIYNETEASPARAAKTGQPDSLGKQQPEKLPKPPGEKTAQNTIAAGATATAVHAAHRISDLEAKLASAMDTTQQLNQRHTSSTEAKHPHSTPKTATQECHKRNAASRTWNGRHWALVSPQVPPTRNNRRISPAPTATSPESAVHNSFTGMHLPGKTMLGARRQKQSTLTAGSGVATSSKDPDPQQILQQPKQPSRWFQNSYKGLARTAASFDGLVD